MAGVGRSAFANAMENAALIQGPRLAIALSGGADSTALLCLLSEWARKPSEQLLAITVDHGLRKESGDEAIHVKTFAQRFNVPHEIHKVQWLEKDKLQRSQLQEMARIKRYQVLKDVCEKNDIAALLVAHNLGDQAETLLMRLGRGSGWNGLVGIPMKTTIPVQPTSKIPLVRPLLSFDKQQLKATCKRFNQEWVEDPSNDSDDFDRIRIRKALVNCDDKMIFQRLSSLQQHAEQAHQELVQAEMELCQKHLKKVDNVLVLNDTFLNDPMVFDELAIRVLTGIVHKVGQKQYPPRVASVNALWNTWNRLDMKTNSKLTLGCCLVRKTRRGIEFTIETKL
ncbi:hypothetical protein THRCLA_07672 [Thraustotheca clavata]|uniref:tRNA(Ile)-lysidine synthetase n=1 Tax=Thraustotheca clavata TaxID=74557 RepID=A0A1V9ZCN1_9STRA|nr:hypothetical protein THRCLA_07672 [Thraustotheca clavata]